MYSRVLKFDGVGAYQKRLVVSTSNLDFNEETKNLQVLIQGDGVTSLTSLEETIDVNNTTVIKAYNLQGQEVPVNTKGKVIIFII